MERGVNLDSRQKPWDNPEGLLKTGIGLGTRGGRLWGKPAGLCGALRAPAAAALQTAPVSPRPAAGRPRQQPTRRGQLFSILPREVRCLVLGCASASLRF